MNTAISFIIVIGALVFFHELGHFLVAKFSGIKVLEFSLGFGPTLIKLKSGETDYTLRSLPVGGYVKMEGEDEKSNDPRSFSNKPALNRLGVILAGPFMNFILAILLISMLGMYAGVATTAINVIPGEPAQMAGLRNGDIVFSIDGIKAGSWDEIVGLISRRPEQTIEVKVIRDKQHISYNIFSSRAPEDQRGIIGITSVIVKGSMFRSVSYGIERTYWFSKMILVGLAKAVMGKAKLDVTGPLGMAGVIGEAAKTGILNLVYLTAIISINLGLINLFPIPALDGGKAVFLLVEILRGKPIEPEKEGFVHFIGFALLMALMVFVIFKDVKELLLNLNLMYPQL